jgi:hypothetical protein
VADASQNRDWRIYHDLAQTLLQRARLRYRKEAIGMALEQTVYALAVTTIDLSRKLFPWARYRHAKAAVKRHTLWDWRGSLPGLISISEGKMAAGRVLDELVLEAGAFYVRARGEVDFQRRYRFVWFRLAPARAPKANRSATVGKHAPWKPERECAATKSPGYATSPASGLTRTNYGAFITWIKTRARAWGFGPTTLSCWTSIAK